MSSTCELTSQNLLKTHRSRSLGFERIRKGVQQNLFLTSGVLIPTALEILMSSMTILIFCGPLYFVNLAGSVLAYHWVTKRISTQRKTFIQKQKEVDQKSDIAISESLQNYFTVQTFGTRALELSKYTQLIKERIEASSNSQGYLARLNLMQRSVILGGTLTNVILALVGVYNGSLTAGDIILLTTVMAQVFGPLWNLGMFYQRWQESFIEINELLELFGQKSSVVEGPNAKDFAPGPGRLELRDVVFAFDQKKVVDHISLVIEPGTFLAVTGPSGCGKSTLLNLLLRFWDPREGQVLLDGHDLRELRFSFRKHISVCPQNHFFFNDTLLSNVRMANIDKYYKTRPAIRSFGTSEQFDEFVPTSQEVEPEILELFTHFQLADKIASLPNGFHYVIGDGGSNLSGGERQRLNLIRCLLKDSQVYIFDEPTNFLDSHNKSLFLEKVEELKRRGKTVIVVSHDLSVVELADKILCLTSNGEFELGDHKTLMSENGKYAQLSEIYNI